MNILLVEDNEINREVVLMLLEEREQEATIAENGERALELLKAAPEQEPYTLILMDCQMPVMDGYEATGKIRKGEAGERYKSIPIIAMTANAMKGDDEVCLLSGMNDYISKPIDENRLWHCLDHWSNISNAD